MFHIIVAAELHTRGLFRRMNYSVKSAGQFDR